MCHNKFFAFLLFATCYVGLSRTEPQCDLVNRTVAGLDKICGYQYTAKFDFDHHFRSASQAVTSLRNLLGNCSETVDTMICSLFVPRCTEEIRGPYLPCRAVCHDYATKCQDIIGKKGLEWTVAMCDILPERDNPHTTKDYRERCFTPPNFKDSGKSYAHNCSDIVVPACKGIPGYTKTVVSKEVQQKYSTWIEKKINYNPNDTCSKPRQEIICAENLPACVDGTAAFLCKDNCYQFFNTCDSPFFYGIDMCMEFPKRGDTPKHSVICNQTHWPRSENWKLSEQPVSTATANVTIPTPTTNVTTPARTDNVTTPASTANVTRPVPMTNGTTSAPTANATTPSLTTKGTTPVPSTNGTTPAPSTKGTTPAPTTKGTTPPPSTKGTASAPSTKGTTPAPSTKGTTPAPSTRGTTPAPTTKGTTPAPSTKGTTPAPSTKGTTPAPSTKGTTPAPTTYGTMTETHKSSTRASSTSGMKGSIPPVVSASKGGKTSGGVIAGTVLGILALLLAIVVGAICFRRYQRTKNPYRHSLMTDMDEL